MAALYIWEFSECLVRDGTQIPKAPGVLQQTPVSLGQGSLQSAQFNNATAFILVTADQICSIAIGTNPIATTGSFRLAQGQAYMFGVNPGDQIAAISNV